MKGLFFDKKLEYRDDLPMPVPAEGEALIRVTKAGICRTDTEIVKGYMDFCGIPGHEFVGVVEKAPDASPDASIVGTRVVGEINCGCGSCGSCRSGERYHCTERTVLGIKGRNGAFAEYLTLPVENLHHVPDDIDDDEAVFVEPLSAAYRIAEQVIVRGKDVLVLGDGKLGLLIAQALSILSAHVTVAGKYPEKLAILDQSPITTVKAGAMKDGMFYDVVVDATGRPEGVGIAMSHAKPRGYIVLKTTVANPSRMDYNQLVINEITLIGSRCGPFERGLVLLESGEIKVKPLIQKTFPLERGLEAFEEAAKPGALKILIG